MKEPQKTGIFAAIAIVALVAALLSQPRVSTVDTSGAKAMVGKELFPEFTDPLTAASLSLVKFDETLGTLSDFEVRKDTQSGLWTIPSHAGYPADATTQMRDAATLFVGMKVLGLASESREDHVLYGVVEPDVNRLKVGDQGVGLLVRIKDGKDKDLASLIVGKEIANQPGRRFVRIPTQDATYDVQINATPLTTEFGKWIEKDLLKLSSFDIAELGIRDYAIATGDGRQVALNKVYDADVAFDSNTSKWNVKNWVTYNNLQPVPQEVPAGMAANDSRLNEVKNALDQLEIVDVDRKPSGLSADLKADRDILENRSPDLLSLRDRGFLPVEIPGRGVEILSTSGELLVALNDGVQYVLRFGNLTGNQTGENGGQLTRAMMVVAKLDESRFPPPELQPLPETIEDLKKLDQASQPPPFTGEKNVPPIAPPTGDEPAADMPAADAPAAETPAAETPAAETPAAETPATDAPAVDKPAEPAPAGDGAGGNARVDSNSSVKLVAFQPPAEQPPAEQPPAEQPPAEQPPSETPAPAEAPPAAAETVAPAEAAAPADAPQPPVAPVQETEEEMKERLELVREEITKANQRKIDERNDRLEKAQKRVKELNARFADWYYVISEDVYKKLRVTQAELVTKPQAGSPQPGGLPGGLPGNFNLPFAPGGN